MDLREKIAEAIEKHEASPTKAYLMLDAVMGVVEEDAVKRRAYTELRVELARKAEAAKWGTRVRALEDENQRLRDAMARAGDFCGRPTACGTLLSRAREIAEEEA